MTGWKLTLRRPVPLRIDLRELSPTALAGLDAAAIERLRLWHGTESLALGEVFTVSCHGSEDLVLEGDLSRADRIGWQMAGGRLRVEGPAGDYLGAAMSAGEILAEGNAGRLAACEMSGGRLEISGDVGDFAASSLPGSMDGMRGGVLVVRGNAGARFGDRMRRGTVVLHGADLQPLHQRDIAASVAHASSGCPEDVNFD